MVDPRTLSTVLRLLRARTGVDASLLPGSLEDAVHRRLEASNASPEEWIARLTDTGDSGDREAAEILALLGIGHTHLFRHRAVWDIIVPDLTVAFADHPLEVLLLGVSTGEEAYTAIMQIGTRIGLENVSALGVDINPRSIAHALRAEYSSRSAEHVPSWAHDRFLESTDSGVRVRDQVRQRARFLSGSLFSVPASGQFDLVLLRHVLIYYRSPERRRALDRAASLCRPGGLLVLGASEGGELAGDAGFESISEGMPIFRRLRSDERTVHVRSQRAPVASPRPRHESSRILDEARVADLLQSALSDENLETLDVDLRTLDAVEPDAAWSLGRGLRLLALRGTVVSVLAPLSGTPRRTLKGTLCGALADRGLVRWEES